MLALTLKALFLLGAVVSSSPPWASAVAVPSNMEDARPSPKAAEGRRGGGGAADAGGEPASRRVDFEDAAPVRARPIEAYSRGQQREEGRAAAAQTPAVNESEKEPTDTLAAAVGAVRSKIAAAQRAQLEAEREAGKAQLAAHLEAKAAARRQAALHEAAKAKAAGLDLEKVPAVHSLRMQLDAARSAQSMLRIQNAQLVEEVDGWKSAAAQIAAHEARAAKLLTERAALLRRAEGAQEERIMGGAAAAAIANSVQILQPWRSMIPSAAWVPSISQWQVLATLGVAVALASSLWLLRAQRKAGLETHDVDLKDKLAPSEKREAAADEVNSGGDVCEMGAALALVDSFVRWSGIGACTIEISELQIGNFLAKGEVCVKVQLLGVGEGKACSRTGALALPDGVADGILRFDAVLTVTTWRWGGPVLLSIVERVGGQEEGVAKVLLSGEELLGFVRREAREYFRFDLTLEEKLRSRAAGAGQKVNGGKPYLAARFNEVSAGGARQAQGRSKSRGQRPKGSSGTSSSVAGVAEATREAEPCGSAASQAPRDELEEVFCRRSRR